MSRPITPAEMKKFFPNASKDSVDANSLPRESIQDLHACYLKHGSIHKAGAEFGMCGETARQHLKKAGISLNNPYWKDGEIEVLRLAYSDLKGVDIKVLSATLGRSYNAIACKAEELGFTSERGHQIPTETALKNLSISASKRMSDPAMKKRMSKSVAEWHSKNEHPRGMLGKTHTHEVRAALSRAHLGRKQTRKAVEARLKGKIAKYGTLAPPRPHGSWKSEWQEIGGKKFFSRSRWEANYARYLEFLKRNSQIADWEHEPKTFWFKGVRRGCCSYLPDFLVKFDGGKQEWHEVKGWMDDRSKTKIKRFAKYFPDEVLIVRDAQWFKMANIRIRPLIKDWQHSKR